MCMRLSVRPSVNQDVENLFPLCQHFRYNRLSLSLYTCIHVSRVSPLRVLLVITVSFPLARLPPLPLGRGHTRLCGHPHFSASFLKIFLWFSNIFILHKIFSFDSLSLHHLISAVLRAVSYVCRIN